NWPDKIGRFRRKIRPKLVQLRVIGKVMGCLLDAFPRPGAVTLSCHLFRAKISSPNLPSVAHPLVEPNLPRRIDRNGRSKTEFILGDPSLVLLIEELIEILNFRLLNVATVKRLFRELGKFGVQRP